MLLLFVSCGQQQRAKLLVKDFVETHISEDVDYLEFSSIDSTHVLNDSIIQAMHRRAGKDIPYYESHDRVLKLLRVTYLKGSDSCTSTFYMDAALTGVVAYKDN